MGLYGNYGGSSPDRTYPHLNLNSKIFSVQGMSAYDSAVAGGFEGTEEEWLVSLVGPQGETGDTGPIGSPMSVWVGSQVEYDALGTWDNETLYFVI